MSVPSSTLLLTGSDLGQGRDNLIIAPLDIEFRENDPCHLKYVVPLCWSRWVS